MGTHTQRCCLWWRYWYTYRSSIMLVSAILLSVNFFFRSHPMCALGHILWSVAGSSMNISEKRHVEYEQVTRPSGERAIKRGKRYYFLSIENIHKLSVNASSLWENPDFYVSSIWPHHLVMFFFSTFILFHWSQLSVLRSEKLVYLPFFRLLLSLLESIEHTNHVESHIKEEKSHSNYQKWLQWKWKLIESNFLCFEWRLAGFCRFCCCCDS